MAELTSEVQFLRASYAALIESSKDIIFQIDQTGRYLFINTLCASLYGQTPAQCIGAVITDLLSSEIAAQRMDLVRQVISSQSLLTTEITTQVQGEERIFVVTLAPVKESAGSGIPSVIGTGRDITHRKRADDERRQLEVKLLQTQKLESLGVLAGGIAHDFNNLLTSILGFADSALFEIDDPEEAARSIEQVVSAAQRAAELTNQMLAYSGRGRFVIEPVNLSEVVRQISQLIRVSIQKRCKLRLDLDSDIPLIEADVTQIRQVAMNLIINAAEALGERFGSVQVRVRSRLCDRTFFSRCVIGEGLPEGSYVMLEITDDGYGMDPDTIDKIFEPFFTTKFTGRGLGLSAVLGIVNGHHGAIYVQSQPGYGTVFRVLFPALDPSVQLPPRPETTEFVWRASGHALVVDDDERVRRLAAAMLERMGFTVSYAGDGVEAVERFARDPAAFKLVLLDYTMPRMDGPETARALRKIRADIAIVITSGYPIESLKATGTSDERKYESFLQKPYRYEQLAQVVLRIMT